MNFSSYASKLLSQHKSTGGGEGEEPLFYSIQSNWEVGFNPEDNILGSSSTSLHSSPVKNLRTKSRQEEVEDEEEGDSEEDDRILNGELNEQITTTTTRKQQIELISSRLWERSTRTMTRGWKAYESTTTANTPFSNQSPYSDEEADELESEEEDDDLSPPTFLSPAPLSSQSNKKITILPSSSSSTKRTIREPLIPSKTLFISPLENNHHHHHLNNNVGGSGIRIKVYQNSSWIVIYGLTSMITLAIALRETFSSSPKGGGGAPNLPTLFPSIPSLEILSLISFSTGFISLFYLITLKSTLRKFIYTALIFSPIIFILIGIFSISQSFDHFSSSAGKGVGGVEEDGGWKLGVRIFGLGMILVGGLLGRYALGKRKKIERCVRVLELATSLLLLHPPLLLLSLSLSLFSLLLTLSFLNLLSQIISNRSLTLLNPSHPGIYLGATPVFVLVVYAWSLGILKGVQRVTVAGVVGGWWFERVDVDVDVDVDEGEEEGEGERDTKVVERLGDESVWNITRGAFARATGASLGSIILSSFLLSLSQSILFLTRRTQSLLRSSSLPTLLNPLTFLLPILAIIVEGLEIYNGFILCFIGLTGESWGVGVRKVGVLMRKGGVGDNLLVRFILNLSTITFSFLTGTITFFLISSSTTTTTTTSSTSILGQAQGIEEEVKLFPWIAILCFIIPYWSLKFCSSLIQDSVDACFLCYQFDIDENTRHCKKAIEAFGEPIRGNLNRV